MRVTSKGQVTIPQNIRERFGFLPDTEVEFQIEGNSVRLVKAGRGRGQRRGANALSRLQGTATVKLTTAEILAMTRRG